MATDLKSKQDLARDNNSNNNASSSSSNNQIDQKLPLVDTTATTTATAKRPRLNYLRSAWTTTDLYYHESAFSQSSFTSSSSSITNDDDNDDNNDNTRPEENLYQIRLPPLHLTDCDEDEDDSDEVLKEIFRMIKVGNVLCLVGSFFSTLIVIYTVPNWKFFIESTDWMPHAILPFYVLWWIIMMRVVRRRTTEHLCQYLNWTQLGAVIMAITTLIIPIRHPTFQHYNLLFVSFSLISCFIFAFAKRIVFANESKTERLKKRLMQQHELLQQTVDKHTEEFSNHRLAFLTTVSQEIQDVALMVITTLEQFSPASILSNAHELLSACSIQVPIASISAINTTIRQVCHVSSHLQLLSKLTIQAWTKNSNGGNNNNTLQLPDLILAEFDIGELLQKLGDALAGVAAKLDVYLVIYHCDNNLHHTLVIGDEGAIRHALLNHIRNILECCTPGASIEVGLNVVNQVKNPKKVDITFYIIHTSSPAIRNASAALLPNANLTAQLLSYIHATCTIDANLDKNQTKFEFSFELDCGKKDNSNKMFLNKDSANYLLKNHYANVKFSNEPSLKELNKFIENLKGLKMILHAPEQSIFAKHMTSCLASWNTDISHVPVAPRMTTGSSTTDEDSPAPSSSGMSEANNSDHSNVTTPNLDHANNMHPLPSPQTPRPPTTPPVPSPAIEEEHIHSIPPAFILIDDDLATLETKLNEFKTQPPASANVLQQAYHGRRSQQQQQQQQGQQHYKKSSLSTSQNFFHQGATTAIIHFTSITNYRAVRDTIQCFAFLPNGACRDPFSMPRVVVVPKPAGPRRFLTALHTAWNNSVVEPHFSAIATSPSSPLPPIYSMMVQREMAAAAAAASASGSNAGSNATSPSHHGGGDHLHPRASPGCNENGGSPSGANNGGSRRQRPLSGIFSPPTGDNYFSSIQQQQPSSSANSPRRRSANMGAVGGSITEIDYLTAKATRPIQDDIAPPLVPGVCGSGASAAVTCTTVASNSPLLTNSSGGNSSLNNLDSSLKLSSSSPKATPAINNDLADPIASTSETTTALDKSAAEPTLKKKLGRTMSNFKLHKKKRKEKPFADVVSPPINVLIVEDNIINQAILSAWMKKHKIKFSVASNGSEAVNKWKTGGFHLILMDIQLPVMNGIEATKMIRSIEKEQKIGVLPMSSSFLRHQQEVAAATAESLVNQEDLCEKSKYELDSVAAEMLMLNNNKDKSSSQDTAPSIFRSPVIIVALTASSLESDRHAALAAGCNDFLTKPVSLEWLEKKIIEWGCMQALIDFEGWRRWKKKSNTDEVSTSTTITTANKMTTITTRRKLAASSSSTTTTTTTTTTTNDTSPTTPTAKEVADALLREQFEAAEKKRIEEKSKLPNKVGIVLPGASDLSKSRRFSMAGNVLAPQSSDKKRSGSSTEITLKPSKSDSDTQTLSRIITTTNKQKQLLTSSSRSRSTFTDKKFDI